jgi:phosphatidylglycerol:prolipoprotein diacylglycerol transferase
MEHIVYNVTFPHLGLSFKVNPLALVFGNIKIYWYGIIVAFAMILAVVCTLYFARRRGINPGVLMDIISISVLASLIGARLYYVIFYPGDFYKNNPLRILNVFEGGLAIYGGLGVGISVGIYMAKRRKIDIKTLLDTAAPGILLGQAIGRWGNFFNQEAFGVITELPWAMSSERTHGTLVHPCFFYEFAWCILGFFILIKRIDSVITDSECTEFTMYSLLHKIDLSLSPFLFYVAWYGFGRFFIEQVRSDSLVMPFAGLKISQVVSVALLVCVTVSVVKKLKTTP